MSRDKFEPGAGPVTVGSLIATGRLLWVYCDGCGHERDVDPGTLNLDPGEPVPGLGRRRMKCSRCGSRNIETRPELYPGGIEAMRARRRGEGH